MSAHAPAPALPDLNAETYPYEVVQHLLDQAASMSFYAIPDEAYREQASITPTNPADFFGINGGYGIDVCCSLNRFDSFIFPAKMRRGLEIDKEVGESVGELRT